MGVENGRKPFSAMKKGFCVNCFKVFEMNPWEIELVVSNAYFPLRKCRRTLKFVKVGINAKSLPINCGCHIWCVENNPLLGSDISGMVHTKTCTVLQCSLIMILKRSNIKDPDTKEAEC